MPTTMDWEQVADRFCDAWTTEDGQPDYTLLRELYSEDGDIVIYDSLPPLEGFRGFDQMTAEMYADDLVALSVERSGPVEKRELGDGSAVVVSYPLSFVYRFEGEPPLEFEARISQVWELQGPGFRIVHEHPSTIIPG
jgi:hypothetical protein